MVQKEKLHESQTNLIGKIGKNLGEDRTRKN